MVLEIGDKDLGLGLVIGDWGSGIRIKDWGLRLVIWIGAWEI